MTGKKNDQDLYEKVDYSLIPLHLITECFNYKLYGNAPGMDIVKSKDYQFFMVIHQILNAEIEVDYIHTLLKEVIEHYGIKSMAASLGLGFSKYKERHNWKKFDSDPERFLRAALRHLMAIIDGADYDHEEGINGYPEGNDHRGAVCFSLMVADNIISKG